MFAMQELEIPESFAQALRTCQYRKIQKGLFLKPQQIMLEFNLYNILIRTIQWLLVL